MFREGNPNRVTQPVAQQRANADGALDASVLALARLGDAQVNRVIPVGTFVLQARYEQPIALDHDLRVARLHGELEVMKVMLAGDAGELQRALDHAERRIAEAVHRSEE